jgi:hypothetical protein
VQGRPESLAGLRGGTEAHHVGYCVRRLPTPRLSLTGGHTQANSLGSQAELGADVSSGGAGGVCREERFMCRKRG